MLISSCEAIKSVHCLFLFILLSIEVNVYKKVQHLGFHKLLSSELSELLRPLEEMQRITTDRLSKLQHSLDVMAHHQRERDANSNINRDMVVLVILVVMIQAVLNWVIRLSYSKSAFLNQRVATQERVVEDFQTGRGLTFSYLE